jgi:hypothetical protein
MFRFTRTTLSMTEGWRKGAGGNGIEIMFYDAVSKLEVYLLLNATVRVV